MIGLTVQGCMNSKTITKMKNKNVKKLNLSFEKVTISRLKQAKINGGREINANTYLPKSCFCAQSELGDC